VIIAMACAGMGEATREDARVRLDELKASALALGVARVVHLGYADSGHGPVLYPDPPDRVRFVRADLDEAAGRLAGLIREEHADVLLSYDARGGNGHRDHVKVHEVGARAAELAGVRVLEATVPRELVTALLTPVRVLRLVVRYDPQVMRTAGSPRSAITHRVSVRRFASRKRAALAAHTSQVVQGKGRSARMFRVLTALPAPIFGLLLGREWFVEPGAAATTISGDILQAAAAGRPVQ
jgi:LmbE family N-acetylglucosaminyl deacetylase